MKFVSKRRDNFGATPHDARDCVMCHVIDRTIPGRTRPFVDARHVRVYPCDSQDVLECATPPEVQKILKGFDNGQFLRAGTTFELDLLVRKAKKSNNNTPSEPRPPQTKHVWARRNGVNTKISLVGAGR